MHLFAPLQKAFRLSTASLFVVMMVVSTGASASTEDAQNLIAQYHETIKKILSSSTDTPTVRSAIQTELAAMVDFPSFAKLALNKYFDGLKKSDKKAYTAAFKGLIEATYVKRIKPGGDHELIFRDDPEERKGKVMVFTTVAKGDNEVDIDYLLHQVDGQGWKIYDIWIDEVSMARNYRSQFYKIYKEHGLRGSKGLLTHMNQRQKAEKK